MRQTKRALLVGACILALASPVRAEPNRYNDNSFNTTDRGGTITTGGVAQTAIAANAARKAWCIQNDPAATETLYVRLNGTASATVGIGLSPGTEACNPAGSLDTAAVSVFAATTGHRWFGFEGN